MAWLFIIFITSVSKLFYMKKSVMKIYNKPEDSDQKAPGKVYLCQVGEKTSCGACCGLYNVACATRDSLKAILKKRTEIFSKTDRTLEGILGFKKKIRRMEPSQRPYPEFHHCPYIGFIGKDSKRVGCLLHPLAPGNNNVDFRGLSYYGAMACRTYFCKSYHNLLPNHKKIIRKSIDDWYVYGLIITETKLLKAFFSKIETMLKRPLTVYEVLSDKKRRQVIKNFSFLKIHWPYRSVKGKYVNYFFEDDLYKRPPVNYAGFNLPSSEYDIFFRELESDFSSPGQLHDGEKIIDKIFCDFLETY